MARPRQDGTPSRQASKRKLTDAFLTSLKPDDARRVVVWDTLQRGLAVAVQPKPSGRKAWKAVYYAPAGRPRWYHIGDADAVGLSDARKIAARVMLQAAEGKDPMAERSRGTFEELAAAYVEQYAKKHNRSWKQADALVRRHVLPRLGKLQAASVARSEVKAMMASIKAPIVANQTLAAASAIFAWGIKEEIVKVNPCALVDRNPTSKRDRILFDSEIPKFWAAFNSAGLVAGAALKTILLTGQRPGEVIKLISRDEMLAMVGVSYAAIWGWIRDGKFPAGRSIGFGKRGHVAWVESEVHAWIASRPVRLPIGHKDNPEKKKNPEKVG